jgi:acyl transferase domain-containing protein/3-hydroxymyristoyl/3-hydroxydecanoyl-(acyl carrier protein) dehydratase
MAEVSRIAIVGIGGLFPSLPDGGPTTPERLWDLVIGRADTARAVPTGRWLLPPEEVFDPTVGVPDRVYSKHGCYVDPFPLDLNGLDLAPELVADLDPLFHFTLRAGAEAFRSAVTHSLDRRRAGVVLGVLALPTEKASALARAYLGRTFAETAGLELTLRSVDPRAARWNGPVVGLPAAVLAKAIGLGGGSYTVDAACASSLYAIKLALEELRAGRADAMLAGGVSRPDCLYTQMGFSQLRALSPSGRCSPFDARADGLVVGEGAGIFVLKRLDDALRDGDRVHAVIAGVGLSNDVGGGLLAPSSEGQVRAMTAAYSEAGWQPQDVDLIECHATGTPVGDAVELASLRTIWGETGWRRGQCVLGSVKATVGHLLTAAGAAGLMKVLAALREGVLPPTANFASPARGIGLDTSPFRILAQAQPWDRRGNGAPRRAAVSAFGFGGVNAHLLLEEFVRAPSTCKGTPSTLGACASIASPIAVIGLDAHFGPWNSLGAVQPRVFGIDTRAPTPPTHWWGAESSEWLHCERPEAANITGYWIDEVAIDASRFRIPPRELEEMLPQQLLLLNVAANAIEKAALPEEVRQRTGAFIGCGLDPNTTNYHFRWSVPAELRDAAHATLTANRVMGALASIAASRVAREFRLGGPSFTLSSGETSGLRALEAAARALERGEIDAALVGAVDFAGDVRTVLTRDLVSPSERVRGDGAVVLVLKRVADAVRDGNAMHTILKGIGVAAGDGIGVRAAARRLAAGEAGLDLPALDKSEPFDAANVFGHCGAALGLASVLAAVLCLDRQVLAPGRYWIRDRADGPRRAEVCQHGSDGNCVTVVLEEETTTASAKRPERRAPLGPVPEALFAVTGASRADLLDGLTRLRRLTQELAHRGAAEVAGAWFRASPPRTADALAVAFVARERNDVERLLDAAPALVTSPADVPASLRDSLFFNPEPLGGAGRLAFVFPGSGNDFRGMGRDLAVRWSEVMRRQDIENERLRSQYVTGKFWVQSTTPLTPRERIFGQVALGTLVADLLSLFGVRPDAALGHSLGESAMLFALRAWTDRDEMFARLNASSLFAGDLTAPFAAAQTTWASRGAAVDWLSLRIDRSADEVRAALTGLPRVYLLLVNAPKECVVGGEARAVRTAVGRLAREGTVIDNPTTVHCPVARAVAEAYRDLHLLPTNPPNGVRFYSAALGRSYDVNRDSAADAILAQALDTVDFPALVQSAYQDGVRLFVEVGPGASCTRMIGAILGDRPHRARSACVPGDDAVSTSLRLLAMLIAERVPVDLRPLFEQVANDSPLATEKRLVVVPVGGRPFTVPKAISFSGNRSASAGPILAESSQLAEVASAPLRVDTVTARAQAHAAFLRYSDSLRQTAGATIAFQTRLLEAMVALRGPAGGTGFAAESRPTLSFDRPQCLEFAAGSIGRVLGSDFAEIDSFPTRVRLPDEPLMLVDRIVAVEGEPRSLHRGRVVTEHDIQAGAWYLDAGRVPTCIAVEAGQADLFLSAFLGIDFVTRGLAAYRLLDAVVTFHRGLPGPGTTIRYDIHIDRFFRQGDTHLFRFRFEASADGEPLLSMTDGCAGFFTATEIAAGKGVVRRGLDRGQRTGSQPDDEADLVPRIAGAFDARQLDALRAGDLVACFGTSFAGLSLSNPLTIAGGQLRLVDRVTELDPRGGRFGIGLIRAEHDVAPDAWFLTCHFVDDQVMPGTLMYECCLHTLRVFLLRLGWVGEQDAVAWEPVPGVASRLRCRGQVTAATGRVTYEVTIKERGYRPEPFVLADAFLCADGKPIVEIVNMSLKLTGQTREGLRAMWRSARRLAGDAKARAAKALFGPDTIRAFSNGKPSEAFGERYRVFDSERVIARLPGPPYQFLDRVVHIDGCEPWTMTAGGVIEAEYDVPPGAWYFDAERSGVMPFAVLLEVALQPCGWLAAYLGSALTSPVDLSFRNLGGKAICVTPVTRDAGTLRTRVRITGVASSGGMIIQNYEFDVSANGQNVYCGATTFGFFTKRALAEQVGIRDAQPWEPPDAQDGRVVAFDFPCRAPFPNDKLRMIDRVVALDLGGGPHSLGVIEGIKTVVPDDWFFRAHFYQDPVCPGSLGLEAMLQLLKVIAVERWPGAGAFVSNCGSEHQWLYRGQVIPTHRQVGVRAVVTARDDATRQLTADGFLEVDGRVIYKMNNFTIRIDQAK